MHLTLPVGTDMSCAVFAKSFFKLGITILADEQVRLVSIQYVQFFVLTIGIFEAVDILQTLNKQSSSINSALRITNP